MLSRPSDSGHTPFGDIFLSQSPDMEFWGRHRHLIGKSGNWWENVKVGGGAAPIETDEPHHYRGQERRGAVPIKTEQGWLHIAHGVRNTAAGLWYVVYVFMTALDDPAKVIAEPGGFLIALRGEERTGDVSNVAFTNGAIVDDNGLLYIYYASSDTRLYVASATVDLMVDFALHTPADALRSADCVKQRCKLVEWNLRNLNK